MRIETIVEPLKLDGKQLCLGCEEIFVLEGYCADYLRVEEQLEARRLGLLGLRGPQATLRVDVGTVEYARPPRHEEMTLGEYAACAALLLVPVGLSGVGLWFLGKQLIGWVLRMTA